MCSSWARDANDTTRSANKQYVLTKVKCILLYPGIHIRSRLVVWDDKKGVWTSRITQKLVRLTSKLKYYYSLPQQLLFTWGTCVLQIPHPFVTSRKTANNLPTFFRYKAPSWMMRYFPLKWLRAQFSCRQPLVFSLMYCINIQARNWHCTCDLIKKMWRYFEGVLPPPSKEKKADEASEKQSKYKEERKCSFLPSWQTNRPWLKFVNSSAAASTSETPATGGAMFCEICQLASKLSRAIAQKNMCLWTVAVCFV